jgi:hypothetical protein
VQNNTHGGQNLHPTFSNLIEVSDDEDNDEDNAEDSDEDMNDDEDSDDENNEHDEDESNDDSSNEDNNNSKNNGVKILKMDNLYSVLSDIDETKVQDLGLNEIDDLENLNNSTVGDDLDELDDLDDLDEENVKNEDPIQIIEDVPEHEDAFKQSFNLDLKTININLVEETKHVEEHKNVEETDYKKMSINKLRNIVLEKGLSTEPSKLKKHEILKMLGVE